jgi:hypothetical protein
MRTKAPSIELRAFGIGVLFRIDVRNVHFFDNFFVRFEQILMPEYFAAFFFMIVVGWDPVLLIGL